MRLSPRLIVALRALTAAFYAASALYGLLTLSPFAYRQLVQPRVLPLLVSFAGLFGALFMASFSIALLSLLGDVQRSRTKALALRHIALVGVSAAILLIYPVMDHLGPDVRSVVFVIAVLLPTLSLAVIDHVACWPMVFAADDAPGASLDAGLFASTVATGIYVWCTYAAIGILRGSPLPQPPGWLWIGPARSLLLHLTMFSAFGWLFAFAIAISAGARRPAVAQYSLMALICCGSIVVVLHGLVMPALAIGGGIGWLVTIACAVAMTATWSGIALRLATATPAPASAIELFVAPLCPARSRRSGLLWLLVLPVLAYLAASQLERMDWAFLLQKTTALAIWLAAGSAMLTLTRNTKPRFSVMVAGSLLLLAVGVGIRARERAAPPADRFPSLLAAESYAAVDPSFRLLADATDGVDEPSTGSPTFYALLKANTNVTLEVPIVPRAIGLSAKMTRAVDRPNIFLFVYDSLRLDYLAPYNPAVDFTPSIAKLASDSLVFQRAFARYGGTGLSVPSIFSGTMLPHRQYVLPFAPMNSLLTLLQGNAYQIAASYDSVVRQIMPYVPGTIALGGHRQRAEDDACQVMDDLGRQLPGLSRDRPVFAYSLPQNTHISYAQGQPIREVHPGFDGPLASRVRQVDSCLGTFIDHLKTAGRYDNSVIVVTADHGDAVGEGGRWGHGSTAFPEIYRVPLIVRLPQSAARWTADVGAVSFVTDITPTLYQLLGDNVTLPAPLAGMPLLYEKGTTPGVERRRGSFLLASSYDPVYILLQRNGGLFYAADALNARDAAFKLPLVGPAQPRPVTAGERAAYRREIAEQVRGIAAFFNFDPELTR